MSGFFVNLPLAEKGSGDASTGVPLARAAEERISPEPECFHHLRRLYHVADM